MQQNKSSIWAGTVLLLAILIGIFVLVWHKSIAGDAALAVITSVVGIAGGAFAVHAGVSAGSKAAKKGSTE